ncbi:hypothetical protein B0H11DRAFT_1973040 [Mycena galericulata]|nr:hypothetical protein B0H11DRAFT_1973040 [Mycena galericulata]
MRGCRVGGRRRDDVDGGVGGCLYLTFMHRLRRTGYGFDGSREVMFGENSAGTELGWCLGWCLGAGIKLVGGVDVPSRVLIYVCGCRDTEIESLIWRVHGIL